jgi:hypothetical protein
MKNKTKAEKSGEMPNEKKSKKSKKGGRY